MTPILNHYFARINWSGAAAVNIDTLRALHLKHNCTIPFENLDVLLPREIQLDDQSLEDKLVIARARSVIKSASITAAHPSFAVGGTGRGKMDC